MPISLQELRTRLHGELITPNDATYETARKVFNGRINKFPALIVFCTTADDVTLAIQFAQQEQLPVAVRSGGHSIPGHGVCDKGLVIDLSRMKSIQIDPQQQTCRAQAGLTLHEFVEATQAYGLATTTGVGTTTGLAGLTLGGGLGWLMGCYGLACDNLLAVELVTADGRLLRASSTEHPDLFWAVRGGGGNFGIVISFEFQLHQVGQVLAGMLIHPFTRAHELLQFYRDVTRACPDELGVYLLLLKTPDGQMLANIITCYNGSLQEGERVLAPLRAFGPPQADLIRPMSLLEANTLINPSEQTAGWHNYQNAHSLTALSDEAIHALVETTATCPAPLALILLEHQHGAACRVAPSATAYVQRDEHYILLATVVWPAGDGTPFIDWAHRFETAIRPFAQNGTYVNYLEDEGEAQIRASYGINYERLTQIKRRYDPTNLFRVNQNIFSSLDTEIA